MFHIGRKRHLVVNCKFGVGPSIRKMCAHWVFGSVGLTRKVGKVYSEFFFWRPSRSLLYETHGLLNREFEPSRGAGRSSS
jgi:hypothetical protein